ncbi:MAG: hypothetical protein IJ680_08955 [Paludibacteraceae bacterium]|nr:hypothetical protein [Paludibacteraceae bacterium]
MKIVTRIILLLLLSIPLTLNASDVRILLHGGSVVQGQIVVQTDDVIIVQDHQGRRYQFLRNQVEDITEVQAEAVSIADTSQAQPSNVVLYVQASAALCHTVVRPTSPAFGVDLMVGHNDLLHRRIFVGGGIGYENIILGESSNWQMLRLLAAARMPLFTTPSPPFAGLQAGYGWAVGSRPHQVSGGVTAAFDLGWQWRFSQRSSLYVSIFCDMQQYQSNKAETSIDQNVYTYSAHRTAATGGLRIGIQL